MLLASSPFDPFFKLFASVLAFFYAITNNYALAIILLTLVVMLIVTPLTLKGTRSMMMMQQLQPEMRKIQARYKDDRQKLNEELLKFYKENNINPLGGCLPLLVQMPVFLVLYQVLRGLTRRVSDLGSGTGWMAGQFPSGTVSKPPDLVRVFDPAWINQNTKMYQNLSTSTSMQAFGMDLSESASKALQQGLLHASPFLVLIVIVAITGFLQQRQIQGRNPNAQVNPQQQMIMKIMPIFLPVISFGLPAGLVLYFAVSNMYRIGQQAIITRHIYGPHHERLAAAQATTATVDVKAREGGKGSGSGGKGAKVEPTPPAPGGFLGKLLGGAEPPQVGKAAREARASERNRGTNGSGSGSNGARKPGKPDATKNGAGGGAAKPVPTTPRPSGRVTPPGSIGNRPASSKKKKRK